MRQTAAYPLAGGHGESRSRARRALQRAALLVPGGIFLAAGLLKLSIFPTFVESTGTFLGLGAPLDQAAAAVVLATEMVAGAALVAGFRVRVFGPVVAALLALFIVVLARAELTGIVASCNCFGTTSINLSYRAQIALDLVLLAMVGFGLRRARPGPPPRSGASA